MRVILLQYTFYGYYLLLLKRSLVFTPTRNLFKKFDTNQLLLKVSNFQIIDFLNIGLVIIVIHYGFSCFF